MWPNRAELFFHVCDIASFTAKLMIQSAYEAMNAARIIIRDVDRVTGSALQLLSHPETSRLSAIAFNKLTVLV